MKENSAGLGLKAFCSTSMAGFMALSNARTLFCPGSPRHGFTYLARHKAAEAKALDSNRYRRHD
jgi:hypothetical protein